jgi:hypothetical protein
MTREVGYPVPLYPDHDSEGVRRRTLKRKEIEKG